METVLFFEREEKTERSQKYIMKIIEGGVCAPKGFRAGGIHCGIRKNHEKKDLALILSEVRCAAAAVYTTNKVQSSPIRICKAHLADGHAQAVICNSGIANTCCAGGDDVAREMAALTAEHTGIAAEDVVVGSTGVIGQPLDTAPIRAGLGDLAAALEAGPAGALAAEEAIMTTDTLPKLAAVEFTLGGKICRLGGIAKGSGMIHPNMATMLVFLTTDAAVSPEMLQKALSTDVRASFNMCSVDGDTSTNDMCCILANGLAGNEPVTAEGPEFSEFMKALNTVTVALCRLIAGDGEGATKLLECTVSGAKDEQAARTAAKSVICSSLVKAAMFGSDANWGRVLCAVGYSGAEVDVNALDLDFRSAAGTVAVCRAGAGIDFSEELAKKVLEEKEIYIDITLHEGSAAATAWGCDLSYDYVKINGDYRT